MIKRLLFYGVNVHTARVPVAQRIELSIQVNLGPAYAAVAWRQSQESQESQESRALTSPTGQGDINRLDS